MVNRIFNMLKKYGVKKGDRVVIYFFIFLVAIVFMLVCVRIGVVYSVVFVGFSVEVLVGRIEDGRYF